MIRNSTAQSLAVEVVVNDFDLTPFSERGTGEGSCPVWRSAIRHTERLKREFVSTECDT